MIWKIALLAALPIFLWGCATPQTMQPYQDSGFLPDYSRLATSLEGGAEVWQKPDSELKKYNKVLLERILVWYKNDAEFKGIDPTTLKALVDYFHGAIVKQLGTAYPVVTEPGPDVMRVRVAITQLVPTQTEMSMVMTAVPYGEVGDLASGAFTKGGSFGSAPYLGDAAIEAMGLDSTTGNLLFEYVDRRMGKKYNIDLDKGVESAVEKGYSSYFKSFTSWGYTKQAFDYWARKFRQRLDEIHGRQTTK
jgi:hypothetical protein